MDVQFDDLGIYYIDVEYLKYLHDNVDSEVYYSPEKYETKPFLGIIVHMGDVPYFIPFTSSKIKHIKWKNIALDHYLIYEKADKVSLSDKAICKPYKENEVLHILAALEIKKMIPVPNGLYSRVDFSEISDIAYRNVLMKEYRFCQKIQDGILEKAKKIYIAQKKTGIVHPCYCNFSELEIACKSYKA